ncbi:DUF4097 family beta strand repeat-containing protein [Paenibacillus sp. PL2-23]|uniref:DUF4097 family beta strand repeat-containing protein n=1 Tax=Paenibacillus sp. PL2-23 TaxID=2100729 RepID=UPI0030F870EB
MGKLRITGRAGRLLAVVFAFLAPGMGHVWMGQYGRGLLLLAGLLLDCTAIFRLADSDGGRHLLLIVYLMLLLPVFYFISVYEVLQAESERVPAALEAVKLAEGVGLAAAGATMLLLIKPPAFLLPWMNELAEWCVGPLLMVAAVCIAMSLRRGGVWVFKLGRWTAAVVIFTVGALLVWDLAKGRNDLVLLSEWWPVIFILLGVEIIAYAGWLNRRRDKLRLDGAGVAAALAITVTAYAVTQYADFPVRWLDQFNVDLSGRMDLGEESGFQFHQNITKIPFGSEVESIKVLNPNGDILVRSGFVDEIELHTTVWVDTEDEQAASSIAEQSVVRITPGENIVLEASGQPFGPNGNRLPRMNLEIVLPQLEVPPAPASEEELPSEEPSAEAEVDEVVSQAEEENGIGVIEGDEADSNSGTEELLEEQAVPALQTLKVELESGNGAISAEDVVAVDGIEIRSASGMVHVSSIHGPVSVIGVNSSIEAEAIAGDSSLVTQNGTIAAEYLSEGDVYVSTLNGDIQLKAVQGAVDAETKNGGIVISGAANDVKADTLNGSIEVSSLEVGGNWDLDSSVGEIKLTVPYIGDYSVYGSVTFGGITTDLPLEQYRKTIRGTIGEGIYRIHINATNSISIHGQEL